MIQGDYLFFSRDGKRVSSGPEGQPAEEHSRLCTILCAVECETGSPFVCYVPRKGTDKYVVSMLVQFVRRLRVGVTFQVDQENPIKAVFEKACQQLGELASLDLSPQHSESLNGIVSGEVRCWLNLLRDRYPNAEPPIDCNHVLMPWLCRHVAFIRARYSVVSGGMTPHEIVTGLSYNGEIADFGEVVLAKVPLEHLSSKADPR